MGKSKKQKKEEAAAKKEAQANLSVDAEVANLSAQAVGKEVAEKAAAVKAKAKVKKEPAPKQIKMNMSLASPERAFDRGGVYDVPKDVSAETAISWIRSKAASKVG